MTSAFERKTANTRALLVNCINKPRNTLTRYSPLKNLLKIVEVES